MVYNKQISASQGLCIVMKIIYAQTPIDKVHKNLHITKSLVQTDSSTLNKDNFVDNYLHYKISLNKRNPNVSPQCDYCNESKETAQHFISDCPAHAKVRMCIFGVPYISLEQIISEYGPKKLLEFIDKTGRTNSNYFPDLS